MASGHGFNFLVIMGSICYGIAHAPLQVNVMVERDFKEIIWIILLMRLSGKSSESRVVGRRFHPLPGHTKDFKIGSNGFPSLALWNVGLTFVLTRWCEDKMDL